MRMLFPIAASFSLNEICARVMMDSSDGILPAVVCDCISRSNSEADLSPASSQYSTSGESALSVTSVHPAGLAIDRLKGRSGSVFRTGMDAAHPARKRKQTAAPIPFHGRGVIIRPVRGEIFLLQA
jgi:hypothetical protein